MRDILEFKDYEMFDLDGATLYRIKVPGGWVLYACGNGMVKIDDPEHKWSLVKEVHQDQIDKMITYDSLVDTDHPSGLKSVKHIPTGAEVFYNTSNDQVMKDLKREIMRRLYWEKDNA